MARMSIRIDLDREGRLGPGKVALLERIAECGSISAAGRAMAMSYRRAWQLVADLNTSFVEPLVTAQMGGRQGGGAKLTAFGTKLVSEYRAIEREAEAAVAPRLRALEDAAAKGEV
ncbi:MAG: winged helix-turn-helix domain-containing protein [Janthinobacterium lividum]